MNQRPLTVECTTNALIAECNGLLALDTKSKGRVMHWELWREVFNENVAELAKRGYHFPRNGTL